jgi:hypothetical protein
VAPCHGDPGKKSWRPRPRGCRHANIDHHRDQGRQGARDKKRGKNPLKKDQVTLYENKPVGRASVPADLRRPDLPPQEKIPNPLNPGIEDCTRLAWSSRRRPGRVARTLSIHLTGRSSGSWIVLLPAPSRDLSSQWPSAGFVPNHSGGTATALHRLPFYPRGTCKLLHFYPVYLRVSREIAGARPNTKVFRSTPRAWATGAHLAWSRNQTRGSAR